MGFNKRYVVLDKCIESLKKNDLKSYYGKSDSLIFEDSVSSQIYSLYCLGKKEKEILLIINQNMEEKNQ